MYFEQLIFIAILAIVGIGWRLHSTRKYPKSDVQSDLKPVALDSIPSSQAALLANPSPQKLEPIEDQKPLAYAFVDLETTGLDAENDRITEICVFVVTPGEQEHDGKSTLVNPGRSLTPFITELTGITDEMLEKKPGEECLHEYFNFIGDCTVYAYNAEFDMGFLRAAARRLGRSFNNPSSCIMDRVKAEHPDLRSYKLTNVCEAFEIEVDMEAHRAGGDVKRALFLWNAVNSGKQPNSSAIRPNRNSTAYGVYGHYRKDGVPFYVWTERNGEPTAPDSDYTWSEYVEKQLQGQYEVRCLKGGITMDQAIDLKNQFLADHAKTVLNRANPYRNIIRENYERYQVSKASFHGHKSKGKELESSHPQEAIEHYKEALLKLNEYAGLVLEEGLFGQVIQNMNMQGSGGDAVKILDRISLLLCKEKKYV